MTSTEFTPGPWRVGDRFGDARTICAGALNHEVEVVCGGNSESPFGDDLQWGVLSEANAHLIAAAPELYAALECILHIFDRELPGESIGRKECYEALSVLAKARGEWSADDILKREG